MGTGAVDPVILYAMRWSTEYAIACVPPATGSVLRLLAAATRPRAIVEVGTGLGVSGLWLMAGAPPRATLTTIDVEPDLHDMARQAYAAAGHAPGGYRLLTGRAQIMLGRLADGAYDLMFVDLFGDHDTDHHDTDDHDVSVAAAARLLRPGGLLVVHQPRGSDHGLVTGPAWTSAQLGADLLAAATTSSTTASSTTARSGS